ncbi:MAG TPA: glycosyltransferase [Anaerolineae bacterium]|nr:glycosyltransferase [Anaerolineae bacterium]
MHWQNGNVIVVGNRGGTNIGGAFARALPRLGYAPRLLEMQEAMRAPMIVRRFNWWLRGRRPTRLREFSHNVVRACENARPLCVITTGIAPLNADALEALERAQVPTFNYLTDDPWNRSQYAPWFLRALPQYQIVWTTRRANMDDLIGLGCREVRYLPFGYDPELHFPEESDAHIEPASDIFFAGGADAARIPVMAALVRAGFELALYGDYWGRYSETRRAYRGYASPDVVRRAVRSTKICLCLVRRANRDGHVMRSYEIPAMRGCMLTEDTAEHRELFGAEGKAVIYFRTNQEMIEKAGWLLAHPDERARLAQTAHKLIANGKHTYQDRLATMLEGLPRGGLAYNTDGNELEYAQV